MDLLTAVSPALKVLFDYAGRPKVTDRPDCLGPGGTGAVIVCNHVGWADSLWMAYAIYPRHLHYMSKQELFGSRLARLILERSGSIPIDRLAPSPSSIKIAVELLLRGEVILIFPSGTRSQENIAYKRGAATIARLASAPIVPAFYQGPANMKVVHFIDRPRVRIAFGRPIETDSLPTGRKTALELTSKLKTAIEDLQFQMMLNSTAA